MRLRRGLAAAVTCAAILGLAGCGGTGSSGSSASRASASSTSIRVALILNGPENDGGWNTIWQKSAAYLKRAVPAAKVTILANINPGAQAQNTERTLATQGYRLIVLTGGYSDADVTSVARQFPKTYFANEAGTALEHNVIPFSAAIEQARYLDGIVAGLATKSNLIGEVGGYPIPIEIRTLNAFEQGVRSVNPKAVTKVLWVNSFYDPTKEHQAAEALVAAGADVLVMDSNTPAVPSVARQHNIPLVGYGISDERLAPSQWLSTFTFNWGPYLATWTRALGAGNLPTRLYNWGLKQSVIGQTSLGRRAPAKAKAMVVAARTKIAAGQLNPFAGTSLESETTPAQLNACCTKFVPGVQGSLAAH